MKKIIALMLACLPAIFVFAQVTTATITGVAKSADGTDLKDATITAVHEPSGTVYKTLARNGGNFTLPGLRVGGPYKITIEFVGKKPVILEDVNLQLSEPFNIVATLENETTELSTVVISAKTPKAVDKSGPVTVVNSKMLTTLPTISRSISDFTRLTPQSNGNSFGGRDGKLNNITVDGANLNNNFGLSTDPFPGAGNNPISLDAVEQVSVSLSPFDVKQGNFTGGNIAAITKSGTNTFHGTAYTYWQNENLVGYRVKDAKANKVDFNTKIYGGSVGGPIIKNKLFFFVNGEYEVKPPAAGITYTPTGGSGTGNISAVTVQDLQKVSDYLVSKGYNPGVYDNYPAFGNDNYKLLGKIDWNINNKNKLTLKYSHFKGTQDFQPSQSGNIGGTFSGTAGATYGPKWSPTAMSFFGVTYKQVDIVKSGSLELNSNFSNKLSNQFLATLTKISSDKIHNGDGPFPFIDILANAPTDNRNYISAGNEPFNGNANSVINDVYTVTDNLTYYAGKHTLTAGLSYEFQKVGNMFMRGSTGYYLFKSVDDFVNNAAPIKYAVTYSLIPGEDQIYSAELKIGQLSAYLQDEINVNAKLKLTAGIRIDQPIYPEQPLENPANSALTFRDLDGNSVKYTTGKFPDAKPLFSPRVGFRWDITGDRKLVLRGGTGIFTGRIPYVYLTNIPTNSGMYQYSSAVTTQTAGVNMSDFKFNPDPNAYNPNYNKNLPANLFPTSAGTVASADFVVADPDFRFPQVWRSNLAADVRFGNGWTLTGELLYSKDIHATAMFNANQAAANTTVTTGSYSRPAYTTSASRKVNSSITNAMVLANTDQGYQFNFTAQLAKTFNFGLSASVAYNYTLAKDVTANPGSQASSIWFANPTSKTANDYQLDPSGFGNPHRVIAILSYSKEYIKHLGTTISFFYEGANNSRYSYIYNGDVNNDGNSQDLMYIPKDATNPAEITFKEGVKIGNTTYTAAQQGQMFEAYIQQDPYLSKHRGQVAERWGALTPWYNRVDMKFLQDIFTNIGKQKHSLQFSIDMYNFLNLLNKDWGIKQLYVVNNPIKYESGNNGTGTPTFSISSIGSGTAAVPVTKSFMDNVSTATTWSIQLGLRYRF